MRKFLYNDTFSKVRTVGQLRIIRFLAKERVPHSSPLGLSTLKEAKSRWVVSRMMDSFDKAGEFDWIKNKKK